MQMTGNTILITGGGSGIGRALAEAFHKLGNQVIIAGRRKALLDSVTTGNPGMQSTILDVQDSAKFRDYTAQIAAQFPSLNVLINNAKRNITHVIVRTGVTIENRKGRSRLEGSNRTDLPLT